MLRKRIPLHPSWNYIIFTRMVDKVSFYLSIRVKIMYFHEGCNGIASFGRSSYGLCVECKTSTKYKCINYKVCVCNRPSCSVAEVDVETDGWVEYISVAYCNS